MAYTALLNNLIESSGLTVKEIAKRCTENGTKITAAYISTLRNATDNRAPSNDVSRALATVCGAKNENVLVIEAYLDNAPEEFNGLIATIRHIMLEAMTSAFENEFPNELIAEIKKQVQEMPVADIIVTLNEKANFDYTKLFGTMNVKHDSQYENWSLHSELKQAVGFEVKDEAMFPTIPKGSKVTLQIKELTEYKNGDILAFVKKDEQNIQYRKVMFLDEEHNNFAMFPINSEYATETYSVKEITIFGKATQVISEL